MKRKLPFLAALLAVFLIFTDQLIAQAPDWTPPPGLQYNMQIVGRLQYTDLSYSDDGDDLVAGFVNNVSRGVTSPVGTNPNDRVYLSIGSNALNGEIITFQAYIATEDTIYAVDLYDDNDDPVINLVFVAGAILGTYADPYTFRLSDNSHTVTFDVTPANGSGGFVIANGNNYDDNETVSVIDGSDLILTFTPTTSAGFHVQSVDYGGPNVFTFPADVDLLQPNGNFIDTLENVTGAVTVTVVYALNEYGLIYTAGPNGVVEWDEDGDTNISGVLEEDLPEVEQTVTHGGDAEEVIAVPDLGYVFYLWSDGVTTAARTDLDVTDSIIVTALFVPTGWTPGSNYQYSMTIVGNLFIDNEISLNENDLVAAFVGGDCRGIASPSFALGGLVFMNIGSNDGSTEEVQLKILDSETGDVCDAGGNILFISNLQLGTLNNPYSIACEVEMELNYGVGFTWFSTNIDIGSWDVNDYFDDDNVAPDPEAEDRIIGQTAFALNTGATWVGGLSQINPKSMYRFRIPTGGNVAKELTIAGAPVALSAINLPAGFTWLGYLPTECQPVNDALDDLTPAAASNDRIIGQTTFAIFNGTTWIGSLTQMCPGAGYIIKLTSASVLNYPAPTSNALKSNEITQQTVVSPIGLEPKANMKNTMTVLGKLELNAQEYSLNPNDVVYAFINGEVRGMAAPTEHDGLIFMSIGDNNEDAKPVHFKVWINNLQQLFDVQGSLAYEALGEAGSLNDPYIFKLDATSQTKNTLSIGQPYPNPFNDQTMIPFSLNKAGQINVKVYNSMGQLVKNMTESRNSAGTHSIAIERENLQAGMYFYVIRVDNNQQTGTLIIN